MPTALLQGIRVIDLAGEPLAMAGRMLADLGAEVIKIEAPEGDPLRLSPPLYRNSSESLRFHAWNAGKRCLHYHRDLQEDDLFQLLKGADIILETPGFDGVLALPSFNKPGETAPQSIWLKATPFGLTGPHAHWQATDLGILAASGNLYATGFPDRAPVRCAEPSSYTHAAAEATFAVLAALLSKQKHASAHLLIDLSMVEAMAITNMGGAGQFFKSGRTGYRMGSNIGRTREAWACKDNGFVSFGLRGGRARLQNFIILLEEFKKAGIQDPAWTERNWENYDVDKLSDEEIKQIEEPLKKLFLTKTMGEWYELAAKTHLMIASANTPKEITESEQLKSRNFFSKLSSSDKKIILEGFPTRWCRVTSLDINTGTSMDAGAKNMAVDISGIPFPVWPEKKAVGNKPGKPICQGLKIVEFGAGAAGPIATRYFAEHGATVIKVESKSRPDFLRAMAYNSPHQLEGSTLFEALNPGKYSITLNLKNAEGLAIAKKLIHWADAVQENFAPKAMKGFGLDYETLVKEKPDLVMVSTCLNGQTGPHKDYPGFGSQGAALAGYNTLTGYPDRDPITPFGTVTDSLGPRFSATAIAAGLLYRQCSGKGVYIDISQVEIATYALAPWLLDYSNNHHFIQRMGNRSLLTAPHGVFPALSSGKPCGDRWVAIALSTDPEKNDVQWKTLAKLIRINADLFPTLASRLAHQDEIEQAISTWTQTHSAASIAEQLQQAGIEAVPLYNFEEQLKDDAQLKARQHFVKLNRPVTGNFYYENNGFRCYSYSGNEIKTTYARPTPLLGEHSEQVLQEFLGYSSEEITALKQKGAIE